MKKKWWMLLLGTALCMLVLCGCHPDGNPLPEGMEAEIVLEEGREVVSLLNEGDYQAVYDRMREDAQETTSVQGVEDYMRSVLDKAGPYQEEDEVMATGQTIKETKEAYATAVLYCRHEKENVMYRIAFDQDMTLMGLEVRAQ